MGQKRTFIITALFALLAGGLFTSCEKVSKPTYYEIVFGFIEFTPPQEIADPELRELYTQMIEDSNKVKSRTDAYWEVWIDNDKFAREDRQAETKYNNNLDLVKNFEETWRKKFEDFGIVSGSSFDIKFVYYVRRWYGSESFIYLQEYNFEIKYN